MAKKTMSVSDLPAFITKALNRGDRVVMQVKRRAPGGPRSSGWWKPVVTLDFRLGELDTESDFVRIPCVVVPPSPFHKRGS